MAATLVQARSKALRDNLTPDSLAFVTPPTVDNLIVAWLTVGAGGTGPAHDGFTTPSDWTLVERVDDSFFEYSNFLYVARVVAQTDFDVTWAETNGEEGSIYIAEFAGVSEGTNNGFELWTDFGNGAGSPRDDFYTQDHTSAADEACLHVQTQPNCAIADNVVWTTTAISGNEGTVLDDHTSRNTVNGVTVDVDVLACTYSNAEAKLQIYGEQQSYGSSYTAGVAYAQLPAAAAADPAPNAPSYVPRGRKVTVQSLPYQVTSEQFMAD